MKQNIKIAKQLIKIAKNVLDYNDNYYGEPDMKISFYRINETQPYFEEELSQDYYFAVYKNDINNYVQNLIKINSKFRYLQDYIIRQNNKNNYSIVSQNSERTPFFNIIINKI